MEPFSKHTGLVVPINRVNVDTDQIVPKQFMKLQTREGYGRVLFYDWRYLPGELPNPQFVLNEPRYAGASVMLTRANFGCGSSREHAPWAILNYGIRAILAPSFAEIFYSNCLKNGILPVVLPDSEIEELFARVLNTEGYAVSVDLESQTIEDHRSFQSTFEIDPFRRECLLKGLDEISLTLARESDITAFEEQNLVVPVRHDPDNGNNKRVPS